MLHSPPWPPLEDPHIGLAAAAVLVPDLVKNVRKKGIEMNKLEITK